MDHDEKIKWVYYVDTGITEGRFLDNKIGVQSGKLDFLYIYVADPKQNRHVERKLINDMKKYAE